MSGETIKEKPWYASKTVIFNVLAVVAAVAAAFGYAGEVPAEWSNLVPVIVAVVNLFLRSVTKRPLTWD